MRVTLTITSTTRDERRTIVMLRKAENRKSGFRITVRKLRSGEYRLTAPVNDRQSAEGLAYGFMQSLYRHHGHGARYTRKSKGA